MRAPPRHSLIGAALLSLAAPAWAADFSIPVLVPVTGFLSLEGTSQRNGAVLAARQAPAGVSVDAPVSDTGVSPEVAVNALEKAVGGKGVVAIGASMLGPQILAMLPLAADYKVPLVTVSGTARVTELDNAYVFRFFPGDAVTKVAHARYVVEELGRKRVALVYQTTAYGQSGREHLAVELKKLGAETVFEEGLEVTVKDMLPVLSKARAANPDVLVIHLHAPSTALIIKQANQMGLGLPIVSGSAMHQPSTAALLEPAELKGVCAESGSSPVSGGSPAMDKFLADYRAAFNSAPDAFALGQYDGTMMVLNALANGARTAAEVQKALAGGTHQGLAMTYRSDGKGNMAHSAIILCYDGSSRTPQVVKRYDNVAGML